MVQTTLNDFEVYYINVFGSLMPLVWCQQWHLACKRIEAKIVLHEILAMRCICSMHVIVTVALPYITPSASATAGRPDPAPQISIYLPAVTMTNNIPILNNRFQQYGKVFPLTFGGFQLTQTCYSVTNGNMFLK